MAEVTRKEQRTVEALKAHSSGLGVKSSRHYFKRITMHLETEALQTKSKGPLAALFPQGHDHAFLEAHQQRDRVHCQTIVVAIRRKQGECLGQWPDTGDFRDPVCAPKKGSVRIIRVNCARFFRSGFSMIKASSRTFHF